MELYNNISSVLSKKNGINLAVGDVYDYMQIWKEWLAGDVADFHHYKVKLASGTTVNKEILTMNMPKKVCEDMAKLLWTEKTQIQLKRKKDTIKLWSILDNKVNNFTTNFPIFIEQVMALGNGALIEYKDNGVTTIDYVTGDLVIPYKYTNSYVYGLITVSRYSEIEDAEKWQIADALNYAQSKTEKDVYDAFQAYEYEVNTLFSSTNITSLGKIGVIPSRPRPLIRFFRIAF